MSAPGEVPNLYRCVQFSSIENRVDYSDSRDGPTFRNRRLRDEIDKRWPTTRGWQGIWMKGHVRIADRALGAAHEVGFFPLRLSRFSRVVLIAVAFHCADYPGAAAQFSA